MRVLKRKMCVEQFWDIVSGQSDGGYHVRFLKIFPHGIYYLPRYYLGILVHLLLLLPLTRYLKNLPDFGSNLLILQCPYTLDSEIPFAIS